MEAEVWWYREPTRIFSSENIGGECPYAQNKDLEGNVVGKRIFVQNSLITRNVVILGMTVEKIIP